MDEEAAGGGYLHVRRDSAGVISGVDVLTKEQFRELADRRMNAASDTTYEESTLMSYVDPSDGKTYYSFDGGKTFEPMTDAEFEARFPTPDVEWWTYDEYKAWLKQEKVALQSLIGETGMTGGVAYVFDQYGTLDARVNHESVELKAPTAGELAQIRALIQEHVDATQSPRGIKLLYSFETMSKHFVKVIPTEYERVLAIVAAAEAVGKTHAQAEKKTFDPNSSLKAVSRAPEEQRNRYPLHTPCASRVCRTET